MVIDFYTQIPSFYNLSYALEWNSMSDNWFVFSAFTKQIMLTQINMMSEQFWNIDNHIQTNYVDRTDKYDVRAILEYS